MSYMCSRCRKRYKRSPWLTILERETGLPVQYRCRRCKERGLNNEVHYMSCFFYYKDELTIFSEQGINPRRNPRDIVLAETGYSNRNRCISGRGSLHIRRPGRVTINTGNLEWVIIPDPH